MSDVGSPAYREWIEDARAVPIAEALGTHAGGLKRQGRELVGPCPVCGGTDRFAVHPRKGLFLCRGAADGDSIALVRHLEGCDFHRAVEILTGRPDPRTGRAESAAQRAERRARQAERQARAEEAGRQRAAEDESFREREIRVARRFWDEARPLAGTLAEAYLMHRGLRCPPGADLRFAPLHGYFLPPDKDHPRVREVWRGPAMLAAITGPDGAFMGLHQTWIDPAFGRAGLLSSPDGKAVIADPETGEVLVSKKVRGSKKGGRIALVRVRRPVGLVRGEGIETTLTVWCALGADPLYAGWAFDCAVDLGNLAGRALDRLDHPTERILRRDGKRGAPRKIEGVAPDMTSPAAPVPGSVRALIHLGDGDSEPFATACALSRAAARHARPGREIRTAMAPAGADFNTVWRAQRAPQEVAV